MIVELDLHVQKKKSHYQVSIIFWSLDRVSLPHFCHEIIHLIA